MIVISAMSTDRVIGSGDGMPWDVPEEYAQYLQFVSGQTIILGRKSFEIFGADLPEGTTPIVVSRSASLANVEVASSLQAALSIGQRIGKTVFVAGGSSIYELAVPIADEMYLSTIKGQFEGDAYFPAFDPTDWQIVEQRHEPRFVFRRYVRVHSAG